MKNKLDWSEKPEDQITPHTYPEDEQHHRLLR